MSKVCNAYMKICVNVTQKFVGNKLQLCHTNFCVTCTQNFLQCTLYTYKFFLIARVARVFIVIISHYYHC